MNNNTNDYNSFYNDKNILLFVGFLGVFCLLIFFVMMCKKSHCCNKYYISKKDDEEYYAAYVKGPIYEDV